MQAEQLTQSQIRWNPPPPTPQAALSSTIISVLARSLLLAEPEINEAHASAVRTLGRSWRWLKPLARRYVEVFAGRARPRHRDVIRFLITDPGFAVARRKYGHRISIAEWPVEPARMQPAAFARGCGLPQIETAGDLAAWLSLNTEELDWFADLKGLGYKLDNPKLQHYYYRILRKRHGGVRVIESPKQRIKELQRRILVGILDRLPAHPAVHGFIKGRSIVTFAAPHVGKQVLLRLDLQDFFPGFPAARVQAFFRTLGYPETVADLFGGVCTNAVPREVWNRCPPAIDVMKWSEARILYTRRHLPQGAPTSPALANITAYRLDCRLSGLAKSAGAAYTRYADDLAFSGDEEFSRSIERFSTQAAAIALEEGFSVNFHKTRIMRQGVRQEVAGIVVNERVNLRRRDLETLEAILTNSVRFGPESQNRLAVPDFRRHLEGCVGFVEMVNRDKGRQLRAIFEAIKWTQ